VCATESRHRLLRDPPDARTVRSARSGGCEPAPVEHIRAGARLLRDALALDPDRTGSVDPDRTGSAVIYGWSAGPGLLSQLSDDVDGLLLGRLAHDVHNLVIALLEAASLAENRAA
jgi:triosephosphate isomerase